MSKTDTNTGLRPTASVAALVLAAGLSRRAAPLNKLLVDVDVDGRGRPMVRAVAETAVAAGCSPVLAVTGFERERIEAALAGLDLQFVANPDFAEGMASSIRHGVAALGQDVAGVLICLGDMPWVRGVTLEALCAGFGAGDAGKIRRPVMAGAPGNPVLFGRAFFAELATLTGDRGAKAVIQAHPEAVLEIAVDDAGIFHDLDQPRV